MISYDYTLKRDEGHGPKTFRPDDLQKELPNLVLIQGKNTKGKSTLLHILALACHGLRNERISETLKDKMQNLISGGDNKLTFSVTITDKDGNIEFKSQKESYDDDEIIVRNSNGELMTAGSINDNYNVIYDIPENPLKRLEEMSLEVEELQRKTSANCKLLFKEMLNTLDDIRSGRNPEKIAEHEKDIEFFKRKIEDHNRKIPILQESLRSLKLYAFLKCYKQYKDKYDSHAIKLAQLKKETTTTQTQKKKTTAAIIKAENEISQIRENILELHKSIALFIPVYLTTVKHKKLVETWLNIDLNKELNEPEFNSKLKLCSPDIQSVLRNILAEHAKDDDVKHAETLAKLISFLEELKDTSYEIPGINITVAKFSDILKKEAKQYEEQSDIIKGLEKNINNLNLIISKRVEIELLIKNYKKIKGDVDVAGATGIEIDPGKERQKIERELQEMSRSKNKYLSRLLELDENISESNVDKLFGEIVMSEERKSLAALQEPELMDKIDERLSELKKKVDVKIKDESELEDIEKDLYRLKKREPHQYHGQLDCLQSFVQVLRSVDIKLDKYTKYLDAAKKGRINMEDPEFTKYYDNLSTYLGGRFRLGSLRYLDEVLDVKKIYIHTKTIETTDGRTINMKNISTGQTMRNYLVQRLHSDDPRKIIALFDEVGMMDRDHLMDVINVIKKLYVQNKLILAVIAQRDDECAKVTAHDLAGIS